eukprot:CAMPEP_0203819430 /NCGR_PEP_ID=MMETSP0115-20131106/35785_1 /ASSEMBLY_ACC=CAM_ASM_000227 /TAXON_ID=33651 /ORGANISM="Bicosoecid sp, Strain ms1" /LENGTH=47 /DNA_ID= /DNA_START= /DNA_END= /DNA_ORIENTATION=
MSVTKRASSSDDDCDACRGRAPAVVAPGAAASAASASPRRVAALSAR